jgi:replication factor A1
MQSQLTSGAIFDFFTSTCETHKKDAKNVQILKIVSTPLPNGSNRYRMIISDGQYHINTLMPSKSINALIVSNQLTKNSIIKVEEYSLKEVKDKKDPSKTTRLVLATGLSVVQRDVDKRIGGPSDISKNPEALQKRRIANSGASKSSSTGAVAKRTHDSNAYDAISSLNPYRNRWTIKARVTKRGPKKTWSNARGEGSLFKVDLLDAEGTEIEATFWKDAVDKFYDMLSDGTVATFSGGKIKQANKKFSTINNDYGITFDTSSVIIPLSENDNSIKTFHFDFQKLANLESMNKDDTLDVIAIVKDFQPCSSIITKKDQREIFKRDLTIVDNSGVSCRCTVWGAEAQKDDATFTNNPVIAIKGARVNEFQGKNVSTGFSSQVFYNESTISETQQMHTWWKTTGNSAPTKTLSSSGSGGGGNRFDKRKPLSSIKIENLGYGEKPSWLDTKGTVNFIKHDGTWCYPACPEEGINKKVVEADGGWLCESNGKTYDAPQWRYIFSMVLSDHSGKEWVTVFDDQAQQLLGVTAGEMKVLQETNEAEFEAKFNKALFTEMQVTLCCKTDTYKVCCFLNDVFPLWI